MHLVPKGLTCSALFCLQFELLICIAESDNGPAVSVVRGLVACYPDISAKVFVGEWT